GPAPMRVSAAGPVPKLQRRIVDPNGIGSADAYGGTDQRAVYVNQPSRVALDNRHMLPHPRRQLKSGGRPALVAGRAAAVLPACVIQIRIRCPVHLDAKAVRTGRVFLPYDVGEGILGSSRVDPEFQRVVTAQIQGG